MRKTNQVLQSILPHIAEEDIPSREIDLWPAIQARLQKPRMLASERKPVRAARRQLRYAILASIVLLALLLTTPTGHSLTQSALHLFTRSRGENQRSVVPASLSSATPGILPVTPTPPIQSTESLTSTPYEPTLDPTPSAMATVMAQPGPTPLPTAVPFASIAEVEQAAGFKLAQPDRLPEGYSLNHISYSPEENAVCLEYYASTSDISNTFSIIESRSKAAPTFFSLFYQGAVDRKTVAIGGSTGGLGWFGTGRIVSTNVCRFNGPGHALQVQTDTLTFTLFARTMQFDSDRRNFLTPLELARLAESLTGVHNIPADQVDPDFITSVADAEHLAGFHLKLPTRLPEGLALDHFTYQKTGAMMTLSAYYLWNRSYFEAVVVNVTTGSTDTLATLDTTRDPKNPEFLKVRVRGTDGIISQGLWDSGVWLRLENGGDGGAGRYWFEDGRLYTIGGFNKYPQATWLDMAESMQ